MGCDGNGSTAAIQIVSCRGQPVAFELLFEFPFFAGLFFHSGSEVHNVAAANQIGKSHLVVARRINLVKGGPGMAIGIFSSRSIVPFDKDPWRSCHASKCFSQACITRPCAYRPCTERTGLSVKFGVIVEVLGKVTLPVETDGDFIKVPMADLF